MTCERKLDRGQVQEKLRLLAEEITEDLSRLESAQSKELLSDFVSELFLSMAKQDQQAVRRTGRAGGAGACGGHCCGEGSWCAVRTVPEALAGELFGKLPGLAERGDDPDPGGGDLRNDPGLFLPGGGPHEAAGGLFRLTISFSSG